MERGEPIEIELRQGLRDLQRKADALRTVFPTPAKAEQFIDRKEKEWTERLKSDRSEELATAANAEKEKQVHAKYNQLQGGLILAITAIGKGQEPDLTFTISEPTPKKPHEIER